MVDTLGKLLKYNAERRSLSTAIVADGERVSFGEHAQRSEQFAAACAGRLLRRQDRLGILAQNCRQYLEVLGAAELSGYIVATLNTRLAAGELIYIINDCTPRLLVFEHVYAPLLESLKESLTSVELYVCIGNCPDWATPYEAFLSEGSGQGLPFDAAADDILHLVYTSGSTGRPKGVMRTQKLELRSAQLKAKETDIRVDERVLLTMPLFHVGSRMSQYATHYMGGCVILHRKFDPAAVASTIEAEKVTLTNMAPTMFHSFIDQPDLDKFDLRSLRTLFYSAAPMPVPLLRRGLEKFGPIFLQGYGSTESMATYLNKTQHGLDGRTNRLGSVGQAPPEISLKIVDENGSECAPGGVGEIIIRSDTTMRGYWNNSAATAEALRDGWYYTGDMGYVDEAGFLYLADRKRDMIVTGGENVYSREVEIALLAHPDVREAAVIGMPDHRWGESVLGVVSLHQGCTLSESDLIDHCKVKIASYKKPRQIVFLEALPLLPTGKVDKVLLRQTYSVRRAPAANHSLPAE